MKIGKNIMMKPNNLFRLNVGFLINQAVGSYRQFEIDAPFIQIDEDTRFNNVKTDIRVSRVQQGILVSVEAGAVIDLECVRCLDPYVQTIDCNFDELYAFHIRQNIGAESYLPENGFIDLLPLLEEYLTLEIPISPLCDENCKGLCDVCGANLNYETCIHHQESEIKS